MTELSLRPITLGTKQLKPLTGLRPLGRTVIVYPLYDAERVGQGELIIIPESAKNPESQQGVVVAAHPEFEFPLLSTVLYHAYSANDAYGAFTYGDERYLRIWDHNIIGRIDEVERSITPRAGHVLVEPEWDNLGESIRTGGVIAIDPTVFSAASPPSKGIVRHTGASVSVLEPGDRILIPPFGGEEVGFIDRVVYLIAEKDILGVLNETPSNDQPEQGVSEGGDWRVADILFPPTPD